ncbi:MAG: hypothetical protein OXG83_08965 [Acidobacteria bacterium]|nr:hypothetical protein [Acidobacteriota bacterium]
MTDDRHDELYVGYLDEAPPGIRRFARRLAVGLIALAAAIGLGLALLLERFDEGVFEYGTVRDYSGELVVDPHPRLITADGPADGYLLVGVGKRELEVDEPSRWPWSPAPPRDIELSGTLIRNPEATMLEVHSFVMSDQVTVAAAEEASDPPGDSQTLIGEIVDTKCYLGAMKPGRGKPHRDCASLCIRGGIPAALLVRTMSGERQLVHLLHASGRPAGPEVLDWVGHPVEITGLLRREDDRLFLTIFGAEAIRATTRTGS